MNQLIAQRVAQLYDASVPDWPGEIDFYRELAGRAESNGEAVLEVACGTGRVAIRRTQEGVSVVAVEAGYGDFFGRELSDESVEMI